MCKNIISVIVPIYNSEQYLHRCIDSILNQTFQNFEVLLIDDGSTDRSGMICDEYAERDKRVRVIHQDNGGVSSARNLGLQEAKGEYIAWCDSDDWIESDMLEKMYNKAREDNADIVFCDYTKVHDSYIEHVSLSNHIKDKCSLLRAMLVNAILGSLWNRLTKRELFNEIRFIPNANMAEDLAATVKQIDIATCISYIPESFYNYDISKTDSLTKITTEEKICRMVSGMTQNYSTIDSIFKKYPLKKEYNHAKLMILQPYLEIDSKTLLNKWQEECDLSLWEIVSDKYMNKGYRLKYCLAKLHIYGLWKWYVKVRQWIG